MPARRKSAAGRAMTGTRHFTIPQASEFAERACVAAGASRAAARSLAEATVSAETWGRTSVGFSHLPDYLAALRDGSIRGHAEPVVTCPVPTLVRVDAMGGIGQLGFDRAVSFVEERARTLGTATLSSTLAFSGCVAEGVGPGLRQLEGRFSAVGLPR